MLPFATAATREYGSIELFDSLAELPGTLPFRYSRFVVAPGKTSRRDQHEVLESWVILSGAGRLYVDDQQFDVAAGDVVRFNPMQVHQVGEPRERRSADLLLLVEA